MIQYGKALKLFKWILQKHREEPATGSGITGETLSLEQQRAHRSTEYEEQTRGFMDDHDGEIERDRDEAAAGSGKGKMDREMIVGKCQHWGMGMGCLDQLKKRMTSNKPSINGGEGFSFKQFREISCVRACMMSLKPNTLVKTPYIPSEEYMALVEGRSREDQKIINNTLNDMRRRASKITGSKKMLPSSKERKQSESCEPAAAINNSQNSNKDAEAQRRNIKASRMKEIVKWQAPKNRERNNRWKIFNKNKGSLSGTSGSEEDLMSLCSSSSKLNKWDIRNCSSSSFSSSGSSSSSSFRGVQSKWEVQSSALCPVPRGNRDNWITTDSEYVVLEI